MGKRLSGYLPYLYIGVLLLTIAASQAVFQGAWQPIAYLFYLIQIVCGFLVAYAYIGQEDRIDALQKRIAELEQKKT